MNNKILATIAVLAIGFSTTAVQAGGRHDHGWQGERGRPAHSHGRGPERARVVHVEPIRERVRHSVPVEHCWNERVRHERRGGDRTTAAVVGGVVGAVIGNHVGEGRGTATAAGAIAGAVIGSQIVRENGRDVRYDTVRRCEVRHEPHVEHRVVAYRVTYELRGRRDVTRLAYDPGRYVSVADIRRRG